MITTTASFISYVATAGQTVFSYGGSSPTPYGFCIQQVSDLKVFIETPAGVRTDITSSIVSITGVGTEAGGNVTIPAQVLNTKVFLVRQSSLTQTTDFSSLNFFDPETVERVVDKLTAIAQDTQDISKSAFRLELGESVAPLTRVERAGKAIAFDLSGDPVLITRNALAELVTSDAIAAKNAAETAQVNAEIAQSSAETAQTNAETAQANAEIAQANAETARSGAETAESNAEAAQIAAESVLAAIDPTQFARLDLSNTPDGTVVNRLLASAAVTFGKLAADVLTAIQNGGFDPNKYQGIWTPATNTPTIPVAGAGNAGQWYFVGAAGTATGNAAGTYAYGDCILSNGTAWRNRPAPPTVIPDDSVTLAKLTAAVKALMATADDYNDFIEVRQDNASRAYLYVKLNGKTWLVLDETVAVNTSNLVSGCVTYTKLADEVKSGVGALDYYADYLEIHLDSTGRKTYAVNRDGTFEAKFPTYLDATDVRSEVTTARGTTANLNARLAGVITPAGRLDRPTWGEWYLRSYIGKARRLVDAQTEKLSVLFLGDSWTHSQTYYIQSLFRALYPNLGGAAGGGFCGFAFFNDSGAINGCADQAFITGLRSTGNWTQEYNVSNAIYALDGTHIKSSTVGASVTVNLLQAHTAVRIHYRKQSGGGTFRWRVDAGLWTNVSTDDTAGYGLLTISVPNAACTINIEVQSGGTNGVILNGLDAQRATGLVFHKCGQSGGTASNWLNFVNDTHFRAGVGHLAPDLCVIMFATNEQNGNVTPATLKANVLALATKVRETRPLCDFLFMCPAANGLTGKTYTMAEYSAALYDAAVEFGAGFISHQQVWGAFSTYKYTADPTLSRNWLGSDDIHPSADGGRVLTNTINNFLCNV